MILRFCKLCNLIPLTDYDAPPSIQPRFRHSLSSRLYGDDVAELMSELYLNTLSREDAAQLNRDDDDDNQQ